MRARDNMLASDMDCLPASWEIQGERRAFAGAAFHPDVTCVFLDDAVGHREVQDRCRDSDPPSAQSWW